MEAARYAGSTSWFLRQAIYEGRLRARRLGKTIVVLRDDLDAFLESQPVIEANNADWLRKRTGAAGAE